MTNSRQRPKLNIPKTTSEWFWDVLGYACYFGSIIFLIVMWGKLPEEVPGHYNALGEVDRWGSKGELLILPGVGAFILILLQILERLPEVHNYPKRFNQSNARQFYLSSRKLVNQLKNVCLILFAFIQVESIVIAVGWNNGFGIFFLPIVIFGLGIPVVIGILRNRKIK